MIWFWIYRRPEWRVYLGTRLRWWRIVGRVCWVWPTRWCPTPWTAEFYQGQLLDITTDSGAYDGTYEVTEIAIDQVKLR